MPAKARLDRAGGVIYLPGVTIVVIDRVAHEMTRLAIEDTLREIEPAEIIILSDRPIIESDRVPVRWIKCSGGSREDAMALLWHVAPQYLRTSHFLHIEWDGWVINCRFWDDRWLEFDYIGALWPWHKENRVGNGGFSLRSARLARYIAAAPDEYPLQHAEDDTLCRKYRVRLEAVGFRWASDKIAQQFSLENGLMRRTFGFHDCRNFPRMLTTEAMAQRQAAANDYVRQHWAWRAMTTNPTAIDLGR